MIQTLNVEVIYELFFSSAETLPILQVLFSVRLDDYEEELNALDKCYYNFLKDKLFEVLVARKLIQAWDYDLNEPNLQWYIDDSSSPGVKCAPHYRKLMFTSIINVDYKELEGFSKNIFVN